MKLRFNKLYASICVLRKSLTLRNGPQEVRVTDLPKIKLYVMIGVLQAYDQKLSI